MAPQSRRVWSLSRACALAGLALLALLPVRAARANGNHTHIGITLMAIELLPPGPLRELLGAADVRQMLVNGTIFPDGGYAIQHEYGETAHWEPFQRALAARIRNQCPDPLASQACREKAAFLFGMASHGMADQVFDALYMAAAKVHDAANWSDGLTDSFDSSTDVLWVAARGGIEPPERWLPMDDLLATFTAVGVSVPATTIEDGQAILLTAVLGFAATPRRCRKPRRATRGAPRTCSMRTRRAHRPRKRASSRAIGCSSGPNGRTAHRPDRKCSPRCRATAATSVRHRHRTTSSPSCSRADSTARAWMRASSASRPWARQRHTRPH